MSDVLKTSNSHSLRDRIAAAIDQRYNNEAIGHTYEVCLHAADAVIAELKLHPVETLDRRYLRWATRWQNNPDWNGGE